MDYQDKYLKYKLKYINLKSHNKHNLLGGAVKNENNTLYLFKAEWCGHCKAFKSTWNELQNNVDNKINFVTYDADKDAKIMKEYNINGFPTLMIKSDNKIIEYNGNRDLNSIKDFINTYNK